MLLQERLVFTRLGLNVSIIINHSYLAKSPPLPTDAFVLPIALSPVAFQYISMTYFNYSWPIPLAFTIYSVSATLFSFVMLFHFNRILAKHGFLDAQHARDGIPDAKLNLTIVSSNPPPNPRVFFDHYVFLVGIGTNAKRSPSRRRVHEIRPLRASQFLDLGSPTYLHLPLRLRLLVLVSNLFKTNHFRRLTSC